MMQSASIKVFSRRVTVGLAVCLVLLSGAAVKAQSASPDVGLVTGLSGEATYWNAGDQTKPARVVVFMKVRRGDLFKLPAGAQLQILYLAAGRQETWKGPATLTAGEGESLAAPGAQPSSPEVKQLPTRVTRKIGASEMPLPRASIRHSGVIPTMGAKTATPGDSPQPPGLCGEAARQEVQEARQTYTRLRQQTPAGDLTPELYYLSVLAETGEYPEMGKLIDTLLRQNPGNATLKELQAWARTQSLKKPQP